MNVELKVIAHIHTAFSSKFGLPRQSGLVKELKGQIVFEEEYAKAEAFRGLEGFSHLWLIWGFSEAKKEKWSPTVRPPRLGGNKRMGVFATRSPFRPNSLGLSVVKIESIEMDKVLGVVINVSGVDLLDNTPIYDIKPYLAFADSVSEATGGFADEVKDYALEVLDNGLLDDFSQSDREAIVGVLANDPRPSYQNDENRVYAFVYAGFEIKFRVKDNLLYVNEVIKLK